MVRRAAAALNVELGAAAAAGLVVVSFALAAALGGGPGAGVSAQVVPGLDEPRRGARLMRVEEAPENRAQPVWTGTRTTPWKITEPGIYTFQPGASLRLTPADAQAGRNAVDIRSSGVTIENLTVAGGYRGFSVQERSRITLRNCRVSGSGIPPKGSRHGGSNILMVNCRQVVLDDCVSQDPKGEHCLYFSGGCADVAVEGSTFAAAAPRPGNYQGVLQVNSEGGSQAVRLRFTNCDVRAKAPEDLVAIMGGGSREEPVAFEAGTLTGGRRFLATNYAAGRPSFVYLRGVRDTAVRFVQEGGSWIRRGD